MHTSNAFRLRKYEREHRNCESRAQPYGEGLWCIVDKVMKLIACEIFMADVTIAPVFVCGLGAA